MAILKQYKCGDCGEANEAMCAVRKPPPKFCPNAKLRDEISQKKHFLPRELPCQLRNAWLYWKKSHSIKVMILNNQ